MAPAGVGTKYAFNPEMEALSADATQTLSAVPRTPEAQFCPLGGQPALAASRIIGACLAASELGTKLDLESLSAYLRVHLRGWLIVGPLPSLDLRPLFDRLVRDPRTRPEELVVPFCNATTLLKGRGVRTHEPDPEAFGQEGPGRRARAEARTRALVRRQRATHPASSQSLGAFLAARGMLTEWQLSVALESQARVGGRLGHHLVLQGFLTEEAVADGLASLHGTAAVGPVDRRLWARARPLPRELLDRHIALPLESARSGWIRLAVADPADATAAEDFQDSLKVRVEPVACPHHVLERARSKLYGVPFSERLLALRDDGSPPTANDVDLSCRVALPLPDVARDPALRPEVARGALTHEVSPLQRSRVPLEPSRFAAALLNCQSEQSVLTNVFESWATTFAAAAWLRVEEGSLVGVNEIGLGPFAARRFRGVRGRLDAVRAIEDVVKRRRPFLGVVENGWLVEELGFVPGTHMAVLPLQDVPGEVVGVLLGNRPCRSPTKTQLEILRAGVRAGMRMAQARDALLRLSAVNSTGVLPSPKRPFASEAWVQASIRRGAPRG